MTIPERAPTSASDEERVGRARQHGTLKPESGAPRPENPPPAQSPAKASASNEDGEKACWAVCQNVSEGCEFFPCSQRMRVAQDRADAKAAAYRAGQESMEEPEDARRARLAKDRQGHDRVLTGMEALMLAEREKWWKAGQERTRERVSHGLRTQWGIEILNVGEALEWLRMLPIEPLPQPPTCETE